MEMKALEKEVSKQFIMDLFGLLSCEDFEDIEKWTCKIGNILNQK